MRTPQASRLLAALLMATAGFSAMAQTSLGGTPERPTVQAPPIDPNRASAMLPQGGMPPPPPGDRMERGGRPDPARMEQRRAEHMQRMQKRLDDQKARLGITAAQAGPWQAYVDAVAMPPPPPAPGTPMGPQGADEWRSLATPQRLDRMRAHREAHNARAERQETAVRNLYAALNPEQQKMFDADFSRHTDPGARMDRKKDEKRKKDGPGRGPGADTPPGAPMPPPPPAPLNR
ncbi:MAG: Spy/CpxP family protein refolding chaperone [Xylophilus ampelinus]